MTDTTRQAAYESGRQARRDGKPIADNPHDPDVDSTLLWLFEAWESGWCDADAMLTALAPHT